MKQAIGLLVLALVGLFIYIEATADDYNTPPTIQHIRADCEKKFNGYAPAVHMCVTDTFTKWYQEEAERRVPLH